MAVETGDEHAIFNLDDFQFMYKSLCFALLASCVTPLLSAQQVDAGNGHAIILDRQGQVWTVGRNDHGQIGDGTLHNHQQPHLVQGLPPITAISRGYDHSMAIDCEGYIWTWGLNNYGQLGDVIPRDRMRPFRLDYAGKFTAVEGGHWHSVAIKDDSTVRAWGHNFYGELGNNSREHTEFPALVRCRDKEDGPINVLSRIVQIASVGYFTLALDVDGTVWAWGSNDFNELGFTKKRRASVAERVPGIPPMKAVATGWHHAAALDLEGHVWVWGSDPTTQFKETTLARLDAPRRLEGLPVIDKIACGSWHSLALDQSGRVWGWGKNHFGMLGTGDTLSTMVPRQIPGLQGIVEIGGGCFQSLAVDREGKIWTSGDNPSGQLGVGTRQRAISPVCMPLRINGQLDNLAAQQSYTTAKVSAAPAPAANSAPGRWGWMHYVLAVSLLGNVIWFWGRLRK